MKNSFLVDVGSLNRAQEKMAESFDADLNASRRSFIKCTGGATIGAIISQVAFSGRAMAQADYPSPGTPLSWKYLICTNCPTAEQRADFVEVETASWSVTISGGFLGRNGVRYRTLTGHIDWGDVPTKRSYEKIAPYGSATLKIPVQLVIQATSRVKLDSGGTVQEADVTRYAALEQQFRAYSNGTTEWASSNGIVTEELEDDGNGKDVMGTPLTGWAAFDHGTLKVAAAWSGHSAQYSASLMIGTPNASVTLSFTGTKTVGALDYGTEEAYWNFAVMDARGVRAHLAGLPEGQ